MEDCHLSRIRGSSGSVSDVEIKQRLNSRDGRLEFRNVPKRFFNEIRDGSFKKAVIQTELVLKRSWKLQHLTEERLLDAVGG